MDATCLPPILKKLTVVAAAAEHASKITVEKFTRPLIFGQKLDIPDVITNPDEKRDNKKDRKKRKRGPRRKKTSSAADGGDDDGNDYTADTAEEEKKE